MTTALVISRPQLTPDVFNMVMQLAPVMHTARLFGTSSQEQAAAIMLKGYEVGFSLTAAFENIHVIDGKPSISPKGCLALIYGSPLYDGLKITDEVDSKGVPTGCTVWMKRKNGVEYTARFSMEDAKRAGIMRSGSGWEKYPANMLRWRAIGYAADVVFPDVIGGIKRSDEFGADITPDGDVIEGSWTVAQQARPSAPTVSQPVAPAAPAFDPDRLQNMLNTHGAAAIMAANNGKIPGTDAELDAIQAKLEGDENVLTT